MPFTYYYRNRPPGIGCQPSGFDLDTREYWCPRKEIDGVPYHGVVNYPEPLVPERVWQYELRSANSVEYAEYMFWLERDPSFDVRADYLSAPRERLQQMARRDVLAGAALIILDALEESKRKRKSQSPIGFRYEDSDGRVITIISEDPLKGPRYYLVEREDGTQWGVKAELLEPLFPLHEKDENAYHNS